MVEANTRALKAGYNYGNTVEAFSGRITVPSRAVVEPGVYRRITGNEAVVYGLVTAAKKANLPLFYGSYPITPASPILEGLAALKNFDVRTFQAEDEIAAMGMPKRRVWATISRSSDVSPELEISKQKSAAVTMPKSP